jgi:NAD(P)-dependent dehydrogenase (short-subunit alcohol dehydrogenase family)
MDLHLGNRTAIVTGGGGAICGAIARALAAEGAKVAVWDLDGPAAERVAAGIRETGGQAIGMACDATRRPDVVAALDRTVEVFGSVDILVAGAGGGRPDATTSPDLSFFDLAEAALHSALDLNYMTAVLPCQEVGRRFAEQGTGVVLVISSIASIRPLTRAVGYSNAKAALNSLVQWLAVEFARSYDVRIRVNAIAPGFVLSQQNRFLLLDEATGQPTERAQQILEHVPLARLGEPEDIAGAATWLVSDQARYVTGVIFPVDGGFTAQAGV